MFHISCVNSLLSVIVSVPNLEVHCSFALVFVSNSYQYFRKVLILHALSCVQNKSYTSGLQQHISIAKSANTSFVNITFYCQLFLFSEAVLQGVSKHNPTKKQLDSEIQVTMFENLKKRTCCRDYRNKLQRQITNQNYLHQNVFSVIFAIWIIFYYCYSNPKRTFLLDRRLFY